MKITDPFLDIYGNVLPNPKHEEKPADNGIYFSSIAVLLKFEVDYEKQVRDAYIKKGLVGRWKGNNFDDCAFDDYLGIASTCIMLGETSIPKEILWYGITHAFFYNTNSKLSANDWLGRHVHVWFLMIIAAYPKTNYLMYPLLWLVKLFFKNPAKLLVENNTSGLLLQWVFLYGCYNSGYFFKKEFFDHQLYLRPAMGIYFHKDHPFNKL